MNKKLLTLVVLTLLILGGNVAYAEVPVQGSGNTGTAGVGTGNKGNPPTTLPTLQNPLKATNVADLLYTIVDVLIFVGVIIATLMFVFIGFKFVMAQGDPTALKEARSWFFYVVIGTVVLVSSKVIVEVLKTTLSSAGVVNEKLFDKP